MYLFFFLDRIVILANNQKLISFLQLSAEKAALAEQLAMEQDMLGEAEEVCLIDCLSRPL